MTAPSPTAPGRLGVAGSASGYRARTTQLLVDVLAAVAPVVDAVDIGAGDGGLAALLMREGLVGRCIPVDIKRRETVEIEPVLFDGHTLPFDDASVDLAYAVDAAHHAADPVRFICEMARVSSRWLLLKDHTHATRAGKLALRAMDEIGNRRFGIGSPGNYQRGFEWFRVLEAGGYRLHHLVHPARCHTGAMGALTNRLQFVALFEKQRGR